MPVRSHMMAASIAAATAGLLPLAGEAQTHIPLGRFPVYSTERRHEVPRWVELPRESRIRTGEGIDLQPLHNSAISFENLKLGLLVGALRNTGRCVSNVSARLQYVDAAWQPMGEAIPNEARVSQVEPGGILPFRFRLRNVADSSAPPAAYVVLVEEDDKPLTDPFSWTRWVSSSATETIDGSPCPPSDTRFDTTVTRTSPLRNGYRVDGRTTLVAGGPVRADGLVVTAVLRDRKGEVLEVLAGTPTFKPRDVPAGVMLTGQAVEFRLQTDIPLGKDVTDVDVMVETLPDAVLGTPPQL